MFRVSVKIAGGEEAAGIGKAGAAYVPTLAPGVGNFPNGHFPRLGRLESGPP